MEEFRLCNSDYRFMMLVWEHAPIGSGELVKLCAEKLGWKKSTTYTEIKRLCEKGVLQNEHAVVTPLVTQEEYQQQESRSVLDFFRIAARIFNCISGKQEIIRERSRGTEKAD